MNTLPACLRLCFLAVLLAALPACAHPPVYSAKEIRGQVVDAQSDEPLEGVIIVAQWELFQIGLGHGGHKGQMVNIIEVVTDNMGNYFIPEWGPRPRPPFHYLDNRDPELSIFKSGYSPQWLANPLLSEKNMNRDSLRTSQWDRKVIRLNKFEGSLEDYADRLYGLRSGLAEDGRKWRSFPRMVIALDAEMRRLKSLGLKPGYGFSILETEKLDEADRQFLKRYEK